MSRYPNGWYWVRSLSLILVALIASACVMLVISRTLGKGKQNKLLDQRSPSATFGTNGLPPPNEGVEVSGLSKDTIFYQYSPKYPNALIVTVRRSKIGSNQNIQRIAVDALLYTRNLGAKKFRPIDNLLVLVQDVSKHQGRDSFVGSHIGGSVLPASKVFQMSFSESELEQIVGAEWTFEPVELQGDYLLYKQLEGKKGTR